MIILKIFSKKNGNWRNLTDLFGFDPDPETKYKNKNNRNFVGRWGKNGEKQPVKGKKRDRSKDKQQTNSNSFTTNSSSSTTSNINNSSATTTTVRVRPPRKKWWKNIKKPTNKQIKNAALITTAATGTVVGGKYLYDKYKDYEQLKLIKNYRKRFES